MKHSATTLDDTPPMVHKDNAMLSLYDALRRRGIDSLIVNGTPTTLRVDLTPAAAYRLALFLGA